VAAPALAIPSAVPTKPGPLPPAAAQAKPAPAPATRATERPPGSPARVTPGLEALVGQWPAIVARLSQNPSLKPLIIVCRPIAVDGNVITLGFPEHQRFYAERIEQKRAPIEQGIAEVLGRDIAIKSVATNLELHPAPPDPDTDRLLDEARRIFGEDLVDVGEVS
jgi:hypothetical protein